MDTKPHIKPFVCRPCATQFGRPIDGPVVCPKCGSANIEPASFAAALKEVDPRKDIADYIRSTLDAVVAQHKESKGDDIAGFAVVTWDRRGTPMTGYLCNQGMVHRALMPAYVADALQQHVIMDMNSERVESFNVPPDAPG